MSSVRRRLSALLVLVAGLVPGAGLALSAGLLGGCGYQTGLSPTMPDGRTAESIGIEIFGNESLLPNLEQPLHAATTKSARRFLDLELRSPGRSDLVLRGSIKDFQRLPGARTPDNLFVETRDVIVIEATLVDRARGVELGTTVVETVVGSAIDIPGREPVQRERALKVAADQIVLSLVTELQYRDTPPPLD